MNRNELKEEYKKMKPRMGVFLVRNRMNNRILVDHATDMPAKWNRHKAELNFGSHQNKLLLADWKSYGETGFVYEEISLLKESDQEEVNYRKELKLLQKMIVDEMKDVDFY